jgi:O-antigen ligase
MPDIVELKSASASVSPPSLEGASNAASPEQVDLWCERGIFGLIIAILVFSPLATGAVRPQDFLVVEWLAVATLVVWTIRFLVNPKHRLLWPPMCWPVLLFMGYAVARYATADIGYVARQETIKVLVYGFLFFAVLNNLHRQETTGVAAGILIFIGMAIAFYALIQFLTESNKVWHFVRPENYLKRGSGTFICPNNMAGYLEMLLPVGVAYTLTGRFTYLRKVFIGYATLMIFTGITVSLSRGGWLATGLSSVVLFVFFVRQRDYRFQALGMLAAWAVIATVLLSQADLTPAQEKRLTTDTAADDVRGLIWAPAAQMWQEHKWWGVGPAHFDHRFRAYRPASTYLQARPDRVHNDYLNTLVDWGMVGAGLVAAAWGCFFWGVIRSWKFVQRAQSDLAAKRSNRTSFVLGGVLGLVAILIHSFFDFNMHIPANAILAVTLLALVAGHFRFGTELYWFTLRSPWRLLVMMVLLAGVGYLGHQSWKLTQEMRWLVRAEALPHYSDGRIAALEQAFAAEGRNFETAYNIGEQLRLKGWNGGDGYEKITRRAMDWFERSIELNPHDPYGWMRYGMCLHWLRRHDEARRYFQRALEVDPNSYYTRAHMGWHYAQTGEWEKVREWMIRSLELNGDPQNTIAWSYLVMAEAKLAERPVSK